ncbi:hypothetical protein P280DRAFT_56687 [Massarina eburnea CBS 473.64]|uniref:CENP-Q, a CENPA-CAD centromere complex subunit-domain-containing protein n=1 Tax=Massarina eburnea CBS 473.64 TaxID=1395130 RepID=A0A6A6RUK8_9PLEO|nr:hypothetical protein P280DRAFT_56687 [Massarina eburnea CBS 473.64]
MAPTRSNDKVVKRRGRPPGSHNKKAAPKPTAAPKQKTGRKKSQNQGEPSRAAKGRGKASDSGERESNDELNEANEPDEISAKQPQTQTQKYVQLAPRTRRIAQDKIDTWPQVSPQVLEQIVGMLRDAKKDIVNTQRDERRVMAAEETLNAWVRKLARQLSASRIPPQAKDIHFNIDKLTERYAHLFREVTTERHSKQLLKEQVKVTQHLLDKDQENLVQLKRNAKEWRAEWKHQEKHGRLHPLLQDLEDAETEGDGPDSIGLRPSRGTDTTSLADVDSPDVELAPLLEQLRRSLESLQGNHEQVAGIDEALLNATAALDEVLFRHARAPQYAAL